MNPFTLNTVDIPDSVTPQLIAAMPQFDTNFTFAGESRFPVLVEYPSIWKGLHGTVTHSDDIAPFTNAIERPCLVWSTFDSQRYDPAFFKTISLNVRGEDVAPVKHPAYYNVKYSYESFERQTDANLFGI